MRTILRLHSITRWRNRHIPSERYETRDTQQRIVPFWTQGLQQSLRPHVHGRHGGHPQQQWSDTQYFADTNESSDVIGRRSRTWNLAHCSSRPKLRSPCNARSRKWDTRKLAPPSKPATWLPMHYSATKVCPMHWRPWTCDFIGCIAEKHSTSINFTGDLEPKIWRITGPSIMQPATTRLLGHKS